MTRSVNKFWKRRLMTMLVLSTLMAAGPVGGARAMSGGGGSSGGGMPSTSTGPRIDPAQSYQEGVAALQAGDYKTAERKFGEVLSVARDHPEANYYMALAKVGRGKEKSSVRYFKRAISEREGFVEAREQLALVYIKLEETEDAVEQLEALKEIKANCTSDTCDQAYIDRTDKAIATVEAALNSGAADTGDDDDDEDVSAVPGEALRFAGLFPTSLETGVARYNAAVSLINQERYDEAIAALYEAQAIYGPHPDILNYLGYAHRKAGMFDAAKDYYAQALRLDPNHRGATEYLGELYLELGEVKKARKQLAKLDRICDFACAEREDLARLIAAKESARSARR